MNAATFAGNLTANGNIVLGNASSDTLAFTGAITLGANSSLTMAVGAAATPSLNFTSSTTTGLSCATANTLVVSTAATARMTISSAGLITIGTGGVIANVLGAVTVPSYSFTGDLNTGMWSSAADVLKFSTAGVERLSIGSSGQIITNNFTADVQVFECYMKKNSGGSATVALFGDDRGFDGSAHTGKCVDIYQNVMGVSTGTLLHCRTSAVDPVFKVAASGLTGFGASTLDAKITVQVLTASGTHLVKTIKNSAGNTRITEIYDADNLLWILGDRSSSAMISANETTKGITLASLAGAGSRTVTADANGLLSAASDSTFKKKLKNQPLPGLAEILQIEPVAYKWKKFDDAEDVEERKKSAIEIGFFADDVFKVIPSAAPKNHDGTHGFYDRSIIAALVKAVQELNAKVLALEAKVNGQPV